jgi:hypothetical protein
MLVIYVQKRYIPPLKPKALVSGLWARAGVSPAWTDCRKAKVRPDCASLNPRLVCLKLKFSTQLIGSSAVWSSLGKERRKA